MATGETTEDELHDDGSAVSERACGSCKGNGRNFAAFWLLGLCNNFSYVIMLSAAYDILGSADSNSTVASDCSSTNASGQLSPLICNPIGTGAILLADILPTLVVKVTAPFFMYKISYNIRAVVVIVFAACSFLLVALAPSGAVWLSITGVVCASFSSGLGEITFLSLTSRFHVNTVSSWSSGTGGAGLFGALSYSGLTQLLSPRTTVLVMLVVPVIEAASYFVLLERPAEIRSWLLRRQHEAGAGSEREYRAPLLIHADGATAMSPQSNAYDYSFKEKLLLIKPLLRYMIPLMFVYLFEYFINQALFELVYFNNACRWLSIKAQYRWYQTIYQLGVFVSRSTVNLFRVKHTWILPILQFGNVLLLLMQIYHHYIPNIWIVFVIILWEGLLGGMGYVNTFYMISKQVAPAHKEYSMGVASMSDSFGILTAALSAIPAHNAICSVGLMTL